MSDRTSDFYSTQSPASDAQPVWNEDRAAWWLANADARERQLQRSQMLSSSERPCSPASAYSMSESALDLPQARRGRRSAPTAQWPASTLRRQ